MRGSDGAGEQHFFCLLKSCLWAGTDISEITSNLTMQHAHFSLKPPSQVLTPISPASFSVPVSEPEEKDKRQRGQGLLPLSSSFSLVRTTFRKHLP